VVGINPAWATSARAWYSATLPPGPRGAPLVGSAFDLRRDVLGTYERARRAYGDVVRFVVGPPGLRATLYAVFHPDAVRRVLAGEADGYRKDNRFYEELRWALGDGLLNSQDERWLRQRRFIQPLFTRRRIAGYAHSMAEEAGDLVNRWRPWAADGRPVDLHSEMSRLTLRVVGRLLFGSDVERAVPVVAEAFPILGEYARARAFAPARLPRGWPTPSNRRAVRAQRAVYAVCDELIAQRRAAPSGGDDLLSLLVDARDNGEQLDDAEIRDQVLIFLLAGHDTTALALTFALHLLGLHPHAARWLRDEVDDVLGDRSATAEDFDALAYTTMVLKEAMRLYPPAWGLGRRTVAGDRIDGCEIPPGSTWRSAPGSRIDIPRSGRSPSASIRSASRPSARPSATATRTSRSAPARARASASTSRCSRPSSRWQSSPSTTSSPRSRNAFRWPRESPCTPRHRCPAG
jgi:cytochrome P450